MFFTIALYSCNKDNQQLENKDSLETSAGKLIASNDFQEYQNSIKGFGDDFKKSFSKLSGSEQNKVKDLLSSLQNQTEEQQKESYELIKSMTNFDFYAKSQKIIEKGAFLDKKINNGVDKKDLILEIKKQKDPTGNNSIRLKSGNEDGNDCQCLVEFTACITQCAISGGDVKTKAACAAICAGLYVWCVCTN